MTVLKLNGQPFDWWEGPAEQNRKSLWSEKTTGGRPVYGSLRSIAWLDRTNQRSLAKFGQPVRVIQSAYNSTVSASAGTHDFDACYDVHIPGVSWETQQRFFREQGSGAYWRRPPAFGNHIHLFVLPPREGASVSDDYRVHGITVGTYVDGGWSRYGRSVGSSQISDYYSHRTALSGHHKDPSWFPPNIRATIFNFNEYVKEQRAKMPRPNTRPIYHDKNYAKANSVEGDRLAAKKNLWADRDLNRVLGGRQIVTHWARPRVEGFRTPEGKVPQRRFSRMSWPTVRGLKTKEGYSIRSVEKALEDARKAGVPGIEFDLKYLPTTRRLKRLAKQAEQFYGKNWKSKVEIKMSVNQPKWKEGLKRADRAGFKTTAIRLGSGNPATLPSYVKAYRR